MLKKTIAYTDYNGTTRKEDFYFNLTQAEVTELEVSVEGGLVEMINRIVAAQNGKVIIETFKDIILRAYGWPSIHQEPGSPRCLRSDRGVQRPVHGAGNRR